MLKRCATPRVAQLMQKGPRSTVPAGLVHHSRPTVWLLGHGSFLGGGGQLETALSAMVGGAPCSPVVEPEHVCACEQAYSVFMHYGRSTRRVGRTVGHHEAVVEGHQVEHLAKLQRKLFSLGLNQDKTGA
jgi:hypothetical protein